MGFAVMGHGLFGDVNRLARLDHWVAGMAPVRAPSAGRVAPLPPR